MNKIFYKKTNTILDKICEQKIQEITYLYKHNNFKEESLFNSKISFKQSLIDKSKLKPSLIAEVKQASPSEGILRKNFDYLKITEEYTLAKASALSVLTDQKFFIGSNQIFTDIRKTTDIPMLRKEFILDPIQLIESKKIGADAILLIAMILDHIQIKDLYQQSKNLGLDVIIEIHDEYELEKIMNINPEIIGVNNRDLRTFKTDLNIFKKLSAQIPNNIIKIAESGINSKIDVELMKNLGADALLIGTTFMKEKNILAKIKELFT